MLIANLDTDYQDQKDIIRQDVLTNAQIVFGTDTSKVSVGFDEDQTLQLIYYPWDSFEYGVYPFDCKVFYRVTRVSFKSL